jgi:hypothetical protein
MSEAVARNMSFAGRYLTVRIFVSTIDGKLRNVLDKFVLVRLPKVLATCEFKRGFEVRNRRHGVLFVFFHRSRRG